jgi:hypothetical protein
MLINKKHKKINSMSQQQQHKPTVTATLHNTKTPVTVEILSSTQYRIIITGNPTAGGIFNLSEAKFKKTKAGKPPTLLAIHTKENSADAFVLDFNGDETARNLAYDMLQQQQQQQQLHPAVTPSPPSSTTITPTVAPITTSSTRPLTTKTTIPPPPPLPSSSPNSIVDASIFSGNTTLSNTKQSEMLEYDRNIKAEILGERKDLEAMYKTLVGDATNKSSRLEEANVFWKHRENLLKEKAAEKQLTSGISGDALKSNIHSLLVPNSNNNNNKSAVATSGSNTNTELTPTNIVINKEWIQRVFLEYPRVLQSYEKHVKGNGMSEKEFWTAYVSSKYVLGEKRVVSRKRQASSGTTAMKASIESDALSRQAKEIFGSVSEASLQRENMGIENDPKRLELLIANLDPAVDLMITAQDAVGGMASVSGMMSSSQTGFGLVHRDGTEKLMAESAKELLNELRSSGKTIDAKIASTVKEAVQGSDPLLSSFNRRSTLAVRAEEFKQRMNINKSSSTSNNDNDINSEEEQRMNVLRRERIQETSMDQIELDGTLLLLSDHDDGTKKDEVMKMKRNPMSFITPVSDTHKSSIPNQQEQISMIDITQYNPDNALLPHHQQGKDQLKHKKLRQQFLSNELSSSFTITLEQLDSAVPGIKDALMDEFFAVDEMTRNYWALADSSRDAKAKAKIAERIKALYHHLDVEMREYMTKVLPPRFTTATILLKSPLAMLDRALTDLTKT